MDNIDSMLQKFKIIKPEYYSIIDAYMLSLILSILGIFISTCKEIICIVLVPRLVDFIIVFLAIPIFSYIIQSSFDIWTIFNLPKEVDNMILDIDNAKNMIDNKNIKEITNNLSPTRN